MNDADWHGRVAALDAEGRTEDAMRAIQYAAFADPDDVALGFMVGERSRDLRRFGSAAAAFALVVLSSDRHLRFRALLEQAGCLRRLGQFDPAIEAIEAAMVLDPGSHWPVVAMADLLAETGRDAERLGILQDRYALLRADAKAEVARYQSAMQAYWHFERTRPAPGWGARPVQRVDALERAGMIMLVKDEADIIAQNLDHHYRLGFRSFCILDNNSADETRRRIETFRRHHADCFVLLIDDPVIGHYQARKMTIYIEPFVRHATLAGKMVEWLFFVDADEFIAIGSDPDDLHAVAKFNQILRDPEAPLIVMHWLHCSSAAVLETFESGDDPFAVFDRVCSRLLPVVPKVAFRVGRAFEPMEGNHFVTELPSGLEAVRTLALDNWFMWHFSLRSIEHVRKKIVNGGIAYRETTGLETHGGHWRQRYRLYLQHGETIVRQVLQNHIDGIKAG